MYINTHTQTITISEIKGREFGKQGVILGWFVVRKGQVQRFIIILEREKANYVGSSSNLKYLGDGGKKTAVSSHPA